MFSFGFWEIFVIVVVALIIFGPKRLPELANKVGKYVAILQRSWQSLKTNVEQELADSDAKSNNKQRKQTTDSNDME